MRFIPRSSLTKSNAVSREPKWHYEAEIITACNCDRGCPCNFNAPPTKGYCDGGWAFKIRRGTCGTVNLDGLAFALMGSWPKAIHEGKGTAKIFIDRRATKEQRALLNQIVRGDFGGRPWPIFAPTFDSWLETDFVHFDWSFDGAKSKFNAGDKVRAELEAMRNPVMGAEVSSRILLPDGITAKELNMTSTKTFSVFSEGMKYAAAGKNAWYSVVKHGN